MSVPPPMLHLAVALSLLTPIVELDWRVQHAVQETRRPEVEPVMRRLSDLGASRLGPLVLLGVAVFSGPAGPATARVAIAAMIPTNLIVEVTKRVTGRQRPDGERKRSNASFPSSHAANAFAMAVVLGLRWRRAAPAFWVLAAAISWSRIYLNRHFLTDVLCAAIIGVACAMLVLAWLRRRDLWVPQMEGPRARPA